MTRMGLWASVAVLAIFQVQMPVEVSASAPRPNHQVYESPFTVFGTASLAAPDTVFAPFHTDTSIQQAAKSSTRDLTIDSQEEEPPAILQLSQVEFSDHEPACVPECRESFEVIGEHWLDRLQLFAGIDGAKQPQDLGVNANLGGRIHANLGIPLVEEWGLGVQIGTAFVAAGNAVAVLETVDGTEGRTQFFTTVGLFQRLPNGINWGAGHDFLYQEYYDNNFLSQWRFQAGYELNESNEIGVWSTLRGMTDDAVIGATTVQLQSINQINVYWNHVWPTAAETAVWVGVCESHGQEVLVFPQDDRTSAMPILGARVNSPLSDYWSLYGETNLMMPADSGTVDAFLGFAFYPGGNAMRQKLTRFRPLLPMGGSPTFSVDLNR